MAQRTPVTSAVPGETQRPASAIRPGWQRVVPRFVIAVGVSAAADVLWWLHQPRHLTGPVDVVGYPTIHNFDYIPSFLAYRLAIYAFPIGALVVYSLLAWRGPLRRPPSARRRRPAAQILDMPAAEPDLQAAQPVTETRAWPVLTAVGRVALPALIVVVAASAGSTSDRQGISATGLRWGLAYMLGVLVLGAVISLARARPSRLAWAQVIPAIRAVNGVGGAMAAVAGLWFVSLHSVVVVPRGNHAQYWPWLPGWLAALGMVAIAAWGALRLRGGRPPAAVEQRLLAVVAGAAAVFLITSRLPYQLGPFSGGFDQAQNLVGAHLLSEGYFPWRDFLFIHGLWLDGLQTTLAFSIFGSTRWGSAAGSAVLLVPLVWVILYLFTVWFSRRNRWFVAGVVVLVLSGLLNASAGPFVFPDVRFIAAPVTLVLLGETLGRRSVSWCAALMFALVIQAILIPETLYLALPVLLVVVAADLTHRGAGGRIWQVMRRSFWCAATGVVLVGAWCAFLAINHALSAWIQYFVIFVPDHAAEGALPPTHVLPRYWAEFGICVVLVLMTFWSVAARVRGGRQWTPRDWVTLAAAGFIALYGEQALGRFDGAHIALTFCAAMPLILLWSEQALSAADGLVRRPWSGTSLGYVVRSPATILAIVVVVVTAPTGVPAVVAAARLIPSYEHATAGSQPAVKGLGYAVPDAAQPTLLRDLTAALNTYAGRNAPVFDMTNSLGYFYFLLDRRPASKFVNVSLAITPYSQQLLIDSLRASRPPVVLLDVRNVTIGVRDWDGARNNVRHYLVSQYLLDKYRPVLDTHGILLLLRNDLMARVPLPPRLTVPPKTTNLYFSDRPCAWSDIPNFLSSPVAGSSVELPVTRERLTVTTVTGLVADPASQAPARLLVLASGRTVLKTLHLGTDGALSPYAQRLHSAVAERGFSATVASRTGSIITAYELAADGKLHPLAGQQHPLAGGTLALPDGRKAHLTAAELGKVLGTTSKDETVGVVTIPAGLRLARFDLLTLHAGGTIGTSAITISDSAAPVPSHDITASVLPASGRSISVRVGSCLQWHGYHSRSLYVMQTGGAAIERLQLSGVKP